MNTNSFFYAKLKNHPPTTAHHFWPFKQNPYYVQQKLQQQQQLQQQSQSNGVYEQSPV